MNMIKPPRLIGIMLITTALILILSGCWDSRELNSIGIVMGVGLDKASAPDDIEMTAQIAKVGEEQPSSSKSKSGQEKSGSSFFFNTSNTGPDVLSILHKLTYTICRKLYFPHNQLIIFGEDLAKEGVRDSFDFFARSIEERMTVYIFVAKGRAGDIFDTEPYLEKIPSMEITTLMRDPIGSIDKTIVFASDFVARLISETTSPVAPMIDVTEEDGKKQFLISGLAIFKGDRLVGELSPEEGRGYQWVTGKVKYSKLGFELNGELMEIIIVSSKSKTTPVIKDDGSVVIRVKITAEGTLDSQTGSTDFSKPENAALLKKEAERTIVQEIENTINKTRGMGADIFGFGESVYQKYPREWKTLKPQWDEIYRNIEVVIEVTAKVSGTGRITKPLYPEKE